MRRLLDLKYTRIVHETEKAYLLAFNYKKVWLPKSIIELHEDDNIVTVPEDIAVDREIENYAE